MKPGIMQVEPASLASLPSLDTHQHLPAGHEVGTLADSLKDTLQLGADEAVVLGDRETREAVREEARWAPVGVSEAGACGWVGWGRSQGSGVMLYPGC